MISQNRFLVLSHFFLYLLWMQPSIAFSGVIPAGTGQVYLTGSDFEGSIIQNNLISIPPNMNWRPILNSLGPVPVGTMGFDDTRSPSPYFYPDTLARRWGVAQSNTDPSNILTSAVGYYYKLVDGYFTSELQGTYNSAQWKDRIKFIPADGTPMPQALKLTFNFTPFTTEVLGFDSNGITGEITLMTPDAAFTSNLLKDGSFDASPEASNEVSTIIRLDPLGISSGFQFQINSSIEQKSFSYGEAAVILGATFSLKDITFSDGSAMGSSGSVIFESGMTYTGIAPIPIPEPVPIVAWSLVTIGICLARKLKSMTSPLESHE